MGTCFERCFAPFIHKFRCPIIIACLVWLTMTLSLTFSIPRKIIDATKVLGDEVPVSHATILASTVLPINDTEPIDFLFGLH